MERSPRAEVSDTTYLELLRSLGSTLLPGIITFAMFVVTAVVCALRSDSQWLTALAVLGAVAASARLAAVLRFRRILAAPDVDLATARQAERMFGATYIGFAAALGLFAAMCIAVSDIAYQLAVTALAVGYAAGVAAGVSLRPWIGVPALAVSVVPTILMSVWVGQEPHLLLAFIMAALLFGAVSSMVARYRAAVEMIEMRQLFASLARQDSLTGLSNRLALQKGFAAAIETYGSKGIVLHCFDLDRFKPVNDVHGHVVGDLLLKALARRLERLVRNSDLPVRLGGDEFAVLQTNVRHRDEGELMARRIARAISEPYMLDDLPVTIGVSIGSAYGMEHGADLTRLLTIADQALYKDKHDDRGRRALAS